jgi:hypothetical protein
MTIAVLALPVLGQDQPKTNDRDAVGPGPEATDSPLVRPRNRPAGSVKADQRHLNDTLLRVGVAHVDP